MPRCRPDSWISSATVKGQSAELCAANLAEIAKFRPGVSVEVATPEVAESLRQAGVTLPISA